MAAGELLNVNDSGVYMSDAGTVWREQAVPIDFNPAEVSSVVASGVLVLLFGAVNSTSTGQNWFINMTAPLSDAASTYGNSEQFYDSDTIHSLRSLLPSNPHI